MDEKTVAEAEQTTEHTGDHSDILHHIQSMIGGILKNTVDKI